MKVNIAYVTALLISSILFGCNKHAPSVSYTGDGELINLKEGFFDAAGWKVSFATFSLAGEHKKTYSFSGIPSLKKWESYDLFLYIPPSVEKESVDDVMLHMKLYANENLVSEYNATLKDWNCWQRSSGDGMHKMFYDLDVKVPASPDVKYTLNVEYDPKEFMTPESGYFFLQIGGRK